MKLHSCLLQINTRCFYSHLKTLGTKLKGKSTDPLYAGIQKSFDRLLFTIYLWHGLPVVYSRRALVGEKTILETILFPSTPRPLSWSGLIWRKEYTNLEKWQFRALTVKRTVITVIPVSKTNAFAEFIPRTAYLFYTRECGFHSFNNLGVF